jgi:hypothetical protein
MRQTAKPGFEEAGDYFITFKDGNLLFIREGQAVSLSSPIVLLNGIVVSTNGVIRFSDGSSRTLGEGDTLSNSGMYEQL